MKNHEQKVYAGGIRNRINRITMRGDGGMHIATYNSNFTDQTTVAGSGIDPRTLISRVTSEPPTERSSQDVVKDNDV